MSVFPNLKATIKQKSSAALKSGQLVPLDTEVDDWEEAGIPFELRLAPIQKKPTVKDPTRQDPFAPPYIDELYITEDKISEELGGEDDEFVILLNKFPVVSGHFLLCTKKFVPQEAPLAPGELAAAYSILQQLGTRQKHLCFYNRGRVSGASQPHKHLQFIPLENGVAPFDQFIETNKPDNAVGPFQLPLGYCNFTVFLNPSTNKRPLGDYLMGHYLAMIDLLMDYFRRLEASQPGNRITMSNLSFALLMTTNYLQIIPRSADVYTTESKETIAINSLGYAGMVLLKSQEALDDLKKVGVLNVLKMLGYPAIESGEAPEEL